MLLSYLEQKLTFRPDKIQYALINSYELEKHVVTIQSGECELYYKRKESPKVVLFFHGNTGNVTFTHKYIPEFEKLGVSYLLVEYPGYGSAQGIPSEEALYESSNVAIDFLINEGIKVEDLIVYGLSLGGVPALELASTRKIHGLVLECAFTDLHEMAKFRFPYIPLWWVISNRYYNQEKIKRCAGRLLILQGGLDQTVSPMMGETLYKNHPGPKQIVRIPEAAHADILEKMGATFYEILNRFVFEAPDSNT